MVDLVTRWLEASGRGLAEYDDHCLELAGDVSESLSREGIGHATLWIESDSGTTAGIVGRYPGKRKDWYYHVVLLVNGFVHDAWLGQRMRLGKYLAFVFPKQRLAVEHRDESGCVTKVGIWRDGKRLGTRRTP